MVIGVPQSGQNFRLESTSDPHLEQHLMGVAGEVLVGVLGTGRGTASVSAAGGLVLAGTADSAGGLAEAPFLIRTLYRQSGQVV